MEFYVNITSIAIVSHISSFYEACTTEGFGNTKAEQVELCIWYYRIQEYVLFGVSKKIKVTALYVTKVIYSVVIFML